ncbi:F-box domain containing protein [Colletotrichum kahawae]|uniref:F-box domain containing protein n=1 Tax=Colletotrichum kahawae TaxID=34407 RepID=A0AAD9Y2C1_COLKA|nr:F-box domain containing protein [Colletotrichum kahawae]
MTSSITSWASPPRHSRIRLVKDRDDIEAIYPLLASYAVTPDSASSVTELAIDPAGWPSGSGCFFGDPNEPLTEPAKPVNEAAHALLEARARDLGLSETLTQTMLQSLAWKKAHLLAQNPDSPEGFVKHNKLYAEVAAVLLLSYTRNVTSLLVGNLEWTPLLKEYLKKSNYAPIPADYRAFPQLETVEVVDLSWKDDERHYYTLEILDYLHYFHRLPSFRNLILDGTGEYQMENLLFPAGTSSPSFKRIQARCTDISGGVLGMLLRAPKGLEEVVVSMGGLWSMDGGSPIVQLKTIGKCLLTQKETLRVLDLDLENGIHARESEEEASMEDYSLDEEGEEVIGVTEATVKKNEYFLLAKAEATGPLLPHRIPDTMRYGYTIGSLHDFVCLFV